MAKTIRAIVTKIGLDGHDRGAKVIASGLKDAGLEVIYLGLRQMPEGIVKTAMEEDVDVIGLSILSGAHLPLVKNLMTELNKHSFNPMVLVGGIIGEEDVPLLKEMGVKEVFHPGTAMDQIVKVINESFAVN